MEPASRNAWAMYIRTPPAMSFSKTVWYEASAMLLTISSTAQLSFTVSSRFIFTNYLCESKSPRGEPAGTVDYWIDSSAQSLLAPAAAM